ncbi:hypothetical protein TVNIR_0230 [Thioalkalivibrio nitratireducens DSM 14787]|uniref:Uncharacterized protein n=1 Tax=Thioalkalivibrio nitratireducens (strain DSM 14787 / UNIQEM 213 / ALEN2) TaxID=1255043 RepID=L0DUC8_THIND|nr:hypothetical protein [Thioalkalivibrio nitratireducens]AGA31941.1 hypothetical protein TVNIR_0230 [Thioalkalivibrio nitratireducens DSM 14787]
MNLEGITDRQAKVRMDAFEAADLLTSLKRHEAQLGDLAQELIAALEAHGVAPIDDDPRPRHEYAPPRDLRRV